MKGLLTLNSSRAKPISKGLTTIEDRFIKNSDFYNVHSIQQPYPAKGYYPCAYHVGQRITNFCVNDDCLLPLCPKCIKIHSEQHEKMSTHCNFATIEQCILECQNSQNSSISRLEQIICVCEDMQILHKQQTNLCQEQINKAKSQMTDFINRVFTLYQEEVDKVILQTSRQFQQQLRLYHKQLTTLLINQKQLAKKTENQNLKLEYLIDVYSKPDLSVLLNSYAARIESIKPEYLQLSVNVYELQRIKVIIKKYLDFGSFTPLIDQKLQSNLSYQRVTISKPHFHTSSNEVLKQFVRSPPIKNLFSAPSNLQTKFDVDQNYGYIQKGQIAKQIGQKLYRESMLDKFESPLEKYSLQKSRRSRRSKS